MLKRALSYILMCIMVFIPSTSMALMRVLGSVTVPENKKSIVLTRDNHSPKVYTGMIAQSTFDEAFDDNPDMIAYVVYPHGPSYTISDAVIEGGITDIYMALDHFDETANIVEDSMIDIGFDSCDVELVDFGNSFYISIFYVDDSQAGRTNMLYYQDSAGIHCITLDFIAYDNIEVWNMYSQSVVQKIIFNVALIDRYLQLPL